MTTNQYRRSAEADARTKEKGRDPGQDATPEQNEQRNSTRETSRETERERGEYLPLAWARLGGAVEPQQFRGKGRRKSRQAAIQAKRGMSGGALIEALGWVSFGAWLAAPLMWLAEVLQ